MKTIHSSASLALFALSFLAGCGSENSVVGGRCRDGMELRGSTCVAPQPSVTPMTPSDPIGATGGSGTNSTGGSGTVSTAGSDLSPVLTTPTRPRAPSSFADPSSSPVQIDPDAVLPPQIEPPIPPAVDPPLPPQPLVCVSPLVACHDVCISGDSDPNNCGACGKICPSNICIAGECQGATPGDVVLIGHDFTNAWSGSAQAKVLVNALSIPTTDPIRILSYEEGASAGAVAQAKALAAAGITGRAVQFTTAESASTLESSTLAKTFDIVFIHAAGPADAATPGASWSDSLGTFTAKGGVVVALDNGLTPMPELMTSSGLLAVASHSLLPDGTHLAVTGAADVVGAQVLSPYAGFGAPISFQGIATPSVDFDWVVRATSSGGDLGDPVVVHRIVRDAKK